MQHTGLLESDIHIVERSVPAQSSSTRNAAVAERQTTVAVRQHLVAENQSVLAAGQQKFAARRLTENRLQFTGTPGTGHQQDDSRPNAALAQFQSSGTPESASITASQF